MPYLTPKDESVVEGLDGLHLYHAGISNCAMRVRMTLEEKGLDWESHHLDIFKKEHLTKEYFAINPKGVVPTLVHNRQIITESDDIINHIEKEFPEPSLSPANANDREVMLHWVHLGPELHIKAIKTYIYYMKIRHNMVQSAEQKAEYEQMQTDKEMLEFHHKSYNNSFTEEEVANAKAILDDCFDKMSAVLAEKPWLAGDKFSLADITWSPVYFTLDVLAGYDFSAYPNVQEWAKRVSERSSYQKGVIDWWPLPLSE